MANVEYNNVIIKVVHDTKENMEANNPILQDGEMGYISDDNGISMIKFGDGVKTWKDLKAFVPNDAKNSQTVQGKTILSNNKLDPALFPDFFAFGNYKITYNIEKNTLDFIYVGD